MLRYPTGDGAVPPSGFLAGGRPNKFCFALWVSGSVCMSAIGCGDERAVSLQEDGRNDAGNATGSGDAGNRTGSGDAGNPTGGADAGNPMDGGGAGGPCYPLTFVGGYNGRLDGDAEQCVAAAESSTPVEAIPRSGFTFRSWSDGSTENPRIIANPQDAAVVTAQFETEGLTTVWLGHSYIRWNVELLYDVARNDAGYDEHEDWMTFSGGAGGAPGSLWANPDRRASGQAMIREQQPDNVVMTFHYLPGSSDYEDYANWVDYTLAHAPNARFYIALPWRPIPFGNEQFEPLIDENGGEDLEPWYDDLYADFSRTVLSALRANYPSSEFIVIPQTLAADRITKAHFAGALTYGADARSLFLRNPRVGELHEHERSIYDDQNGHPGGPLRLLTMILYFRYIYGVEMSAFDLWQSKQSFSNVGLQGIGPKETFDVPYTYYNDYDFPAVADALFDAYGRGE